MLPRGERSGPPGGRSSLVRSHRRAPSRTCSAEAAQETGEQKSRAPGPGKVARAYFDAVAARDPHGMAACWAPGGVENIAPLGRPLAVPDEMIAFFEETFAAMPDMRFEVLDVVAARNQAAVRWHATGTFCGGPFQGIEPTGARVELEGIDLLTIEDGKIVRNDAYYDSGAVRARRSGCCRLRRARPSGAWRRPSTRARACCGRSSRRPSSQVAEGVWLVRGGFPMKTHERVPDRGRGRGDGVRRRHPRR